MITENNTGSAINPELRNELASIVRQAMEQREQKAEADKTVYRRICAELNEELGSFDYTKPDTYINSKGQTTVYNRPVPCGYRLKNALSTLLRIAYRADTVAKLPSENEEDIKRFMLDTLERMRALGEPPKTRTEIMDRHNALYQVK